MSTTIQLSEDTVSFLKALRDQFNAPSYDALLKLLIEKAMRPHKSMAGVLGKMSMKDILKDLRDKSDRF